MAYLNAADREKLANELKNLKFNQAKGKVRRLDSKSRLAFYRNSQGIGRWLTRYDLPTLGTRVTLVESYQTVEKNGKLRSDFELNEVVVEPLPGNNS
jgi:hypothetical protein